MNKSIKLLDEIGPTKNTVMIASFKGFSDSTGAAASTIDYLIEEWDAKPIIEIDPDPFYDYSSTRPHVKIKQDKRVIEWPAPTIYLAKHPKGQHDFILLSAPEPNLKWKTFAEIMLEIIDLFNCSTSITLGAQPAAIPHTRPVLINLSTSDSKFEKLFDLKAPSFRYQGPTGITGILNLIFREQKMDNASLWALMPHYLSFGSNPNVIEAIIKKIDMGFGTSTSLNKLEAKKDNFIEQVEQALKSSPESMAYIDELESEYDKSNSIVQDQINFDGETELTLPSSNEIIGDVEEFLKENREEAP
jgi:proteasome assembly chaperone (PAC2) family protein